MRLNGWQRIGVVLSVLWAMAAWFYARHVDLDLHSRVLNLEYKQCAELPSEKEHTDCIERARRDFNASLQADWLYVSAVALLPIPIAWLIAYGLVALVRWIRARLRSA